LLYFSTYTSLYIGVYVPVLIAQLNPF
jgi:hypothetical protein